MHAREIVLPITDHETEWVRGRVQGELLVALWPWAVGRGEVASERRFRVPARRATPAAFASNKAIEVLSPRDRSADVASKIDVYLASERVIVVDQAARTMTLQKGVRPAIVRAGDTSQHAALPEFALDIGAAFANALARPF